MSGIDPQQTHLGNTLKGKSPMIACRFDPSGRHLFTASQDNLVTRGHLATGSPTPLVGHASWVRSIAFVPAAHDQDAQVITADYQGKIRWWPLEHDQPECLRVVSGHSGWIRAATVSPDGQTLATGGNDAQVRLWSTQTGEELRTLSGHDCHVYNLAFHPDGDRLVTADHKGTLIDWDWQASKQIRQLDASALHKYDKSFRADIGGARALTFSPDGQTLGCAGITNVSNAFAGVGNPLIVLLDWEAGKVMRKLTPKKAFRGTAWGMAFHPEGFMIAVGGGSGGQLWFWEGDEEKSTHTVKLPKHGRDLALHPDGRSLAVAQYDNAARIYALYAKAEKK